MSEAICVKPEDQLEVPHDELEREVDPKVREKQNIFRIPRNVCMVFGFVSISVRNYVASKFLLQPFFLKCRV